MLLLHVSQLNKYGEEKTGDHKGHNLCDMMWSSKNSSNIIIEKCTVCDVTTGLKPATLLSFIQK